MMDSTAEAEIAAAYTDAREAVPIRTALAELGHPRPATLIKVENSTCHGFTNDTIKQRRTKSIDMNHYWKQNRIDL